MPTMHNRTEKSAAYHAFSMSFMCLALIIFLTYCSAEFSLQNGKHLTNSSALTTQYSIVFVIHGDGAYLFHNNSGIEYIADEEILVKAKRIAQQNSYAEVFIFHQKPRPYFLFFFPQKDGEFYYYRNNELISNETYWRDQEQSQLAPEVNIYRSFHANNQGEMTNIFLYFGHEIPEVNGAGYDKSYTDREFTVDDLAIGLKDLTRDSTRIDLIILSTCYGGTPYTIGKLGSFAKYVIASPENLHLSYFDLNLLERLELSMPNRDNYTFAKKIALQAFNRLTSEIQTSVSVVLYDIDRIKEYLSPIQSDYKNRLIKLREDAQDYLELIEHCDCADIPDYLMPIFGKGIDVFYRSARFGREKNKQNHSGWECLKLIKR